MSWILHKLVCALLVITMAGVAPIFEDESDCQDDAGQCDCTTCIVTCSCCPAGPGVVVAPRLLSFVQVAVRARGVAVELVATSVGTDIFHPPRA